MRVIILCGGSGSRLWPESRESLPKQYISLINKKSLLDLTIERFLTLLQKKKPIFVCNKNHGFLVKQAIEKYNLDADIFLEPEGKNTCAAIYLAAKHSSENEDLLITPSDHYIPDNKKFLQDISIIESNLQSNQLITLGVKPTKPSEAYGYIKINKSKNSLLEVLKFIEKPKKSVAQKYINSNNFYWNAGIFIGKASRFINAVNKHAPNIASFCDKAYEKIIENSEKNQFNFPKNLFSQIPSQSIDYAVMEHESNIFLYPLTYEWSDVGSWDSIEKIQNKKLSNSKIIEIDSRNNFIRSKFRTIATIGIEDLIIIDSDNATLISKKNHSEKVKLVVKELSKKKLLEAKEHTFEKRPWGKFENLINDKHCKVKRLTVHPQKRLSLQYHNFRSEHWLVVSGTANIFLNGKMKILRVGESIDIPVKSPHYIHNKKNEDLIIIETQLGSYFGEDDIIRLDDPYLR